MSRERSREPIQTPTRAILLLVGAVLIAATAFYFNRTPQSVPAQETTSSIERQRPTAAAYAGSQSCRDCHAQAFDAWQKSNHALAERAVDAAHDDLFFQPSREIKHGTQVSQAKASDGRFDLITRGEDGAMKAFPAERVIGYKPLHQYILPAQKGRFQVSELAVDPEKKEWFDVFGSEDRQPGEWGHWSGRGMTWNSICAACHNTFLQKNYSVSSDSYATTMAERSIGCEACHGPKADHVAWQKQTVKESKRDPTLQRLNDEHYFAVCASCHARRTELTGQFIPGDKFLDHYSPVLPNDTETYYADGQVHEEDFEYVSFLGSRMHSQGVRCVTCHEPHGGKVRVTGNTLCMQCHNGKIDPAAHSHHKAETPGGNCVDCHMPQTAYMQRHMRRDHGMTIPDPRLTKEHGVPNACNRCHLDKNVDWAIEASDKWFGDKLNRPTQQRARIIARARAGADVAEPLMKLLRDDPDPFWKAVSAELLSRFAPRTEVRELLVQLTQHADPLVRSGAVRALDAVAQQPEVKEALAKLLHDPIRVVRIDVAWALRRTLTLDSNNGKELLSFLDLNADFPSAMLQRAVLDMDRGNPKNALPLLKKAVTWDGNSVPLKQALASASSAIGDSAEAVTQLEKACQIEPRNAALQFSLGLACGETGQLENAIKAFKNAVTLDPNFGRAWYNLGLAYSKQNQPLEALDAIKHAEAADTNAADFPYVRAIVLLNMGKTDEARNAVLRALQLDPNHQGAREFLRQVGAP